MPFIKSLPTGLPISMGIALEIQQVVDYLESDAHAEAVIAEGGNLGFGGAAEDGAALRRGTEEGSGLARDPVLINLAGLFRITAVEVFANLAGGKFPESVGEAANHPEVARVAYPGSRRGEDVVAEQHRNVVAPLVADGGLAAAHDRIVHGVVVD